MSTDHKEYIEKYRTLADCGLRMQEDNGFSDPVAAGLAVRDAQCLTGEAILLLCEAWLAKQGVAVLDACTCGEERETTEQGVTFWTEQAGSVVVPLHVSIILNFIFEAMVKE